MDHPATADSAPVTPDAGAESGVPPADARELVARFSRALQRATVYPQGHPSVLVAVAPFLDGLRALRPACPQVVVGVTRESLFVGTRADNALPYASPWLSARLSAHNIAMITFDGALSAEEGQKALAWLASGESLGPDVAPPTFEGCHIRRVDYSAARFRQAPASTSADSPDALAWKTIARALLAGTDETVTDVPESPAELAGWIREQIELHEGTGVTELGRRLVDIGAQLANLPENVRASVKAKLSELVAALSPELRGQVLNAAPADTAEKLLLLSQMVEHLPRAEVVDVIKNLEFTRGGSTHQFLSLMLKLTSLAASDAHVADALEARYTREGLPGDLAYADPERTTRVLEELLSRRPTDLVGVNPEDYQHRLEDLSVRAPTVRPHAFDPTRHVDPRDAEAVAAHTGRIALQLLRDDSEPAEEAMFCERLRAQLPAYLASRDFELLADICVQLTSRCASQSSVVAHAADAALRFFSEAGTIAAVLEAVLTGSADVTPALMVLARAGGGAFVEAMLRALDVRATPQMGRRAAALLPTLDLDAVRAAFGLAYRRDPAGARGLVALLRAASGLPVVVDVGHLFLADRDPAVRLDAYQLLFGNRLSPSRFEALLRRALDDEEARVVRLALDEAEARVPPIGAEALAHFVDHAPAGRVELQRRAVAILAAHRTPAARAALIATLASRSRRLESSARHVSQLVASALETLGGDDAMSAVRAWRWSPAGMLARVMGVDGGGRA